MRIGIDARLTYYRAGGISWYISNLVRELEALNPTHDITVFHSRKATETISNSFKRADLWTPSHHRIERTALSIELFSHRLDLFHSTDFIPPRMGAQAFVISVHDLSFIYYPQFITRDSKRYYTDQIEAAVEKADHILTISEFSKQDIITKLGVPSDKITVHVLGVDQMFRPQPPEKVQEVIESLDLPDNYYLFVGTFEPRKNIPGLLQAYSILRARNEHTPPLVIAGRRGWLFDEIMAEVKELALGDMVLWREHIPQEQLPALYTGATALLMPSFYEGFGLPALEAMACGTVPIVSNVSSLPEVVGNVGILIDPEHPRSIAEAMEKVHEDVEWRDSQEQAALQQAAQFSWKETASVALNVYESVLHV